MHTRIAGGCLYHASVALGKPINKKSQVSKRCLTFLFIWYNIIIEKEIPAISGFSTCWLETNRRSVEVRAVVSFLFMYVNKIITFCCQKFGNKER